MTWLAFALMTVASWGVYGVLLHMGQSAMNVPGSAPDPNARYKAFLFVGIAYFLTAIVAPLVVLKLNQASMVMPSKGMMLSLVAGIAGAVGAFCVLLAFGAKGHPAVVMSIVFAGAPIVNALVAMMQHPPHGGVSAIKWQFWLGLVLASAGGYLVARHRPMPPAPSPPAPTAMQAP